MNFGLRVLDVSNNLINIILVGVFQPINKTLCIDNNPIKSWFYSYEHINYFIEKALKNMKVTE